MNIILQFLQCRKNRGGGLEDANPHAATQNLCQLVFKVHEYLSTETLLTDGPIPVYVCFVPSVRLRKN